MDDTNKKCQYCIHLKTCNARSNYDSIAEEWNKQFPYVKMNEDADLLAEICTEYKTLSQIHIIEKEVKNESHKKGGIFSV